MSSNYGFLFNIEKLITAEDQKSELLQTVSNEI